MNGRQAVTWVLCSLLLSFATPGSAQESNPPEDQPPSQVIPNMLAALVENPGQPRDKLLAPFLERIQTVALTPDEEYLLGEAYFIAALPMRALPYFETARNSTAAYGRLAWQRAILIEHNANNAHDRAEMLQAEYRKTFRPEPNDLWGLYQPVNSMAGRYRRAGQHDKVVSIVMAELESLGDDAPYQSLQLPATFLDSFETVGKKQIALDILRNARDRLVENLPSSTDEPGRGRCLRMEDIIALTGSSYGIGAEVRCDTRFRRQNLLEALEAALDDHQ